MPNCFSNLNNLIIFLIFMIAICFLLKNNNIESFKNENDSISMIHDLYNEELNETDHYNAVDNVLSKMGLDNIDHRHNDSKKIIKATYVRQLLNSQKHENPIDGITQSVHDLLSSDEKTNSRSIKKSLLKLNIANKLVNNKLNKMSEIKKSLNNTFLENNRPKLNIIAAAIKAHKDLQSMDSGLSNTIENTRNGLINGVSNVMDNIDNLPSEFENTAMSVGNTMESAIDNISDYMSFDSVPTSAGMINTVSEQGSAVDDVATGSVMDSIGVQGSAGSVMDSIGGDITAGSVMDSVSGNSIGTDVADVVDVVDVAAGSIMDTVSGSFNALWD